MFQVSRANPCRTLAVGGSPLESGLLPSGIRGRLVGFREIAQLALARAKHVGMLLLE